jgi:CDP-diacylglycerol--glycerol-3-phosphate 3-phosphatidyltransferase
MALTVGRIVLAPIFFILYSSAGSGSAAVFALWGVFALIEASDLLDGHMARALKQESEIGKVLDPFADSISRITYFICFAGSGYLPLWILLLLVYRDVAVSYLRVMISRQGVMLAARLSGKLKAWVYGVGGGAGIALLTMDKLGWGSAYLGLARTAAFVLFLACGAVALWTLADYGAFLRNFLKKSS